MLYWQGNAHMRDSAAQAEYRTNKLRDWLLALLRYAVTLHDADKSAVLLIAEEIDKLGSRAEYRSAFEFFRGTSTELCSAILDRQNSMRSAILRLHLKRIDDWRLRRAFEAAIEFGDTSQIVSSVNKIRKRGSQKLWEGLRR
jgi:alkyl sulfatase BDS1-like metallo-beta-lactamase superfamily hydrolase